MKRFSTQGPVNPEQHYVVARTEELAEFIKRIKEGRYIVIFAPRQTGKTTLFYAAMDILAAEEPTYLPIHLDFEAYKNLTPSDFYSNLTEDIREEIENLYQKRREVPSEALRDFLENINLTDNVSMIRNFRALARLLEDQRVVVFIDEFDGIPPAVVSDFLYALRRIYISRTFPDVPTALALLVSGVSHNLTTIVLSLRSISMTILLCPILRLLRCKSSLGNTQTRSDKPSFQK